MIGGNLVALLACACLLTAHAQYRFDHWTTENGLPHNSIRALQQTRDGYLWLTTGDGLVRFDGVRFKVFNRTNTPEMTSNNFSFFALHEDRQGALWAGTTNGGVIRYQNGIFTAYTTREGLASNTVSRIDEDAEGTIWIFTVGGLTQWKNERLSLIAPAPGSAFNDHLNPPENVGGDALFFGLWRRDATGWERFAYGQWKSLPLPPHLKDPAKLRIDSIIEDSKHRLWYDLSDRADEFYGVSEGRLSVFRGSGFPGIGRARDVNVCYQDRQGRLLVGDVTGQVVLWQAGRRFPLAGLATSDVFRVWEDHEGGLWIGTKNEGLYRLREPAVTVLRHPGGTGFNAIITALPVHKDREDAIWLGCAYLGGLSRLSAGRYENFYRPGTVKTDFANIVSALFVDHDGALWLGTWNGVVRFYSERRQWVEEKNLSAQMGKEVRIIYRDRTGALWFGSHDRMTCLREGKLTQYTRQQGLGGTSRALLEDRTGTLWVTTNGGLSRFNGTEFTTLTVADGLSSNDLSALYEDEAGVLWVGSLDGGLNRLANGPNGMAITHYTTVHGLTSSTVYQILPDAQGFFWISCHLGVYRVRKQELDDFAAGQITHINSTLFDRDDGFLNQECTYGGQPAGFRSHDGKLLFPTHDGLAQIDPQTVRSNPTPPPLLIEECMLDRQSAASQTGLQIMPGQGNLEINYTALSFIKSEQIRFRYKLEGLDQDWVEAGTRRTAYYPYLPSGAYTFKVIAANSDGVWNKEGQSLRVVVLPPFYRRWWFLLLSSAALAGFAALAYQYRIRQLQRRQLAQQAFARQLIASQEAERKRIAAELHDSLGQHLVVIKNLALMWLQTPTHNGDARQQIEDISATTSQAISEVKEISYNLRPYQLDRIGLTKAIEALLKKAEAASGIHFQSELDDLHAALPKEAEINFYRIIQECVNNILKHSHATEAMISIRLRGPQLQMTLRDNGKGFTPGTTPSETAPGGFGLLGISERAQLLGGQAVIRSAPGQGTTIYLEIELRQGGARRHDQ